MKDVAIKAGERPPLVTRQLEKGARETDDSLIVQVTRSRFKVKQAVCV